MAGRKHGGQKRGGRKRGVTNLVTREIKGMAAQYGPDALKELARLSKHAESEQARVAACKELLDRAYGRPAQPVEHSGGLTLEQLVAGATADSGVLVNGHESSR